MDTVNTYLQLIFFNSFELNWFSCKDSKILKSFLLSCRDVLRNKLHLADLGYQNYYDHAHSQALINLLTSRYSPTMTEKASPYFKKNYIKYSLWKYKYVGPKFKKKFIQNQNVLDN